MKLTFAVISVATVLFVQVFAAPANTTTSVVDPTTTDPAGPTESPVLHCANDAGDRCPPGWTCCGPIFPGVGGTCVNLEPGFVCIS